MFIIYCLSHKNMFNEDRDLFLTIFFFTCVSFQVLNTLNIFNEYLLNSGMNFFSCVAIVS